MLICKVNTKRNNDAIYENNLVGKYLDFFGYQMHQLQVFEDKEVKNLSNGIQQIHFFMYKSTYLFTAGATLVTERVLKLN